ncbi:MAG: translocation/assembly module TamB domain-containing protein [Pseudomonadota bacterium]
MRRLAIAVLALVLPLGLVSLPASAQFSFLGIKNNLVQLLLEQISVPGEFEVTAEEVVEPDDGSTALRGLAIADADGVWLRIGQVGLDWSPTALLGGTIEINRLAAEDVEYLRAPGASVTVKEDEEPEAEEEEGSIFDWPRAPLTLRVQELRLERVSIEPGAIAAQGLAFDAVGSARDEGDEQAIRLEVTRRDETEGRILLDYLRTFDANTLNLTLEADEAAGGLVAEFAGLPATSASRARIVAEGPLTDWELTLDVVSERVIEVKGGLSVGLETPLNIVADLQATPGEEMSQTAQRLLAPEATLSFALVEGDDGVIRIERGTLESPEIALAATGFYDTGSGAVDIDVDLSAAPGLVADADDMRFETLALTARVDGDGTDLDAVGELRIAGLASPSADIGLALLETTIAQRGERLEFSVDGDLDAIRIDRLGPEVLGDGTLTARGSAEGSVFELSTMRFDSQPLRIEAQGRTDSEANTLGFDYLASAERLDPIAAAYDADASGAFRMEGRVDGTLDLPRLAGSIALEGLRLEDETFGAVRLTHDATFGAEPEGRLDLAAEGSRFGPATLGTAFRLAGDDLALSGLALRALDAAVDGDVTVDLSRTLLEGAVTLDIPSLAETEAATGIALAGRGSGRVTLGSETLAEGFGTSREMQVADIDFTFDDFRGFDAAVDRLGISGRLTDILDRVGGDLVIALDGARHPQAELARGQIEAELVSLTRLGSANLAYRLEEVAVPGQAGLAVFEGTASVTEIDRSPSAAVEAVARDIRIEAVEGGAVEELRLTAFLDDLAGAPAGTVTAEIDRIAVAGYTIETVTAETDVADLSAAGRANGSILARTVSGPDAAVDTAAVDFALEDLTGSPGGTVSAEVSGIAAAGYTIAQVAADTELAALTGAATAKGTVTAEAVSGPDAQVARAEVIFDMADLTGNPGGTVDAVIEEIGAAGFTVARVEAESVLATLVQDPAVKLQARVGQIAGAGIAASGLTLDADLSALGGNGQGTASLVLSDVSGSAVARSVRVDADMTGLISPAGRVQARTQGLATGGAEIGDARLDARLTERSGRTDVAATLDVPAVAAEGLEVEAVTLTAAIRDALGRPGIDTKLAVGRIGGPGLEIENPSLTAQGPLSALDIALDAEGLMDRKPLSATLRARADLDGNPQAEIATMRLALDEAEVALEQPLRVRSAGGVTRLDALALLLPGGRIAGDAVLYPSGASGNLRLDFSDLGQLKTLAAESPISRGSLEFETSFDTRRGRARADIDAQAAGLGFDDAVGDVGDLGLEITGRWDGRRLVNDIALTGPFGEPFRVNAGLGLVPSGGPAPTLPANAGLDGSVRWAGDVGDLWVLVPLPDHVLDGRLDIDLALSGTVEAPEIGGQVQMREGQYQNLDTGTILTDLTLDTELQSVDTIALVFSGRDGASGTLDGRVALSPDGIDATVAAQSAVLVRRDDVTAQISTDIAAKGPLTGFALSGTTTIERAEVRLVNALPPSVATLGDVRIKGEPIPVEDEGAGGDITLDLKIRADRSVFVRGRGLDSSWNVDLDIDGTAARPRIVGDVTRARGSLDLLGKSFQLTEGEVTFTGGREIDPRLNVALSHTNQDITGFIRVRGNASDPEIVFESDPSLPEEEVLPRTVFGQSSQSLSATQAIQLASAVTTLLDGSGGVIDDIRGAAGVDVLRFDTDAEGEAEVTVGKNVAEGVFVGATQPVAGGESKVTVEVEVFSNVTVDGEVGSEGSTSVGVNWRKDF